MSLFERMERKLERTVNGVFARAFRSEVQPLELASAVRRAMDDRATMLGRGRTIVPNLFTVELSETDYARLTEFDQELENELVSAAEEHAESQRYQPGGPLQVIFHEDDALETGVFRVRPATARQRLADDADGRPASSGTSSRGTGGSATGGSGRGGGHGAQSGSSQDAVGSRHVPGDDYGDSHDRGYDPTSDDSAGYEQGYDDAAYAGAGGADDYDEYTTGSWELQQDPAAPVDEPPTRPHEPVAPPVPPATRVSVDDRPWLEVDGERYPLLGAMTVLGRDDTADIVLDDPGISRRHCEVRVTHDGPRLMSHLRDLGSTNGTYVNGEGTDATRLADGDVITVGRTEVLFRARR